jgi:hypothetical protein
MKRAKKKSIPCQAVDCDAKSLPGGDLCERHQRMEDAEPCSLEHCDRPQYAKELCEAHYRRKMRFEKKGGGGAGRWDAPILQARTETRLVATRIPADHLDALRSTLGKDEKLYGRVAEIISQWLEQRGLVHSEQRAA